MQCLFLVTLLLRLRSKMFSLFFQKPMNLSFFLRLKFEEKWMRFSGSFIFRHVFSCASTWSAFCFGNGNMIGPKTSTHWPGRLCKGVGQSVWFLHVSSFLFHSRPLLLVQTIVSGGSKFFLSYEKVFEHKSFFLQNSTKVLFVF